MRVLRILLILLIFSVSQSYAQNRNNSAIEYIERYKSLAIQEMISTGIPASITLAQGMHESANGTSQLARNANNHFGVKCSSNWTGKRYHRNGNKRNSCFRKYNTVEEAFKDRSRFLSNNKNYQKLFKYNRTDYKKWAYGLQKSGYAASRYYAAHLIKTIERYNLHQFDLIDSAVIDTLAIKTDSLFVDTGIVTPKSVNSKADVKSKSETKIYHKVKSGESLYTIAKKYKVKVEALKKQNKLKSNKIKPGQRLLIK